VHGFIAFSNLGFRRLESSSEAAFCGSGAETASRARFATAQKCGIKSFSGPEMTGCGMVAG
jgi:hypothetical protein